MRITAITVLTDRHGPDKLVLKFSFASGCWPYTEAATATMDCAHGTGEAYAKQHFADTPIQVVSVAP